MTMTQVKWQFLPEPTFGFASNTIEDEFCQARAHIQNFYFDTSHKLATRNLFLPTFSIRMHEFLIHSATPLCGSTSVVLGF